MSKYFFDVRYVDAQGCTYFIHRWESREDAYLDRDTYIDNQENPIKDCPGFSHREIIEAESERQDTRPRFEVFQMPNTGYKWNTPAFGARFGFSVITPGGSIIRDDFKSEQEAKDFCAAHESESYLVCDGRYDVMLKHV